MVKYWHRKELRYSETGHVPDPSFDFFKVEKVR